MQIRYYKSKNEVYVRPRTSVILAAAGCGRRMLDACENKLFILLGDTEVIGHSLIAFEKAETVDDIIIVTSRDSIYPIKEICNTCGISKLSSIITGGADRKDSVLEGIKNLPEATEYVCIADGNRPFIKPATIDSVNRAAYNSGAAAACVYVTDTIKERNESGDIYKTVDRSKLLAAQTPQTFRKDIYLNALSKAKKDINYTDDCSIVESIGQKVTPVLSDYFNIKLTTPEDIVFAQNIYSVLYE